MPPYNANVDANPKDSLPIASFPLVRSGLPWVIASIVKLTIVVNRYSKYAIKLLVIGKAAAENVVWSTWIYQSKTKRMVSKPNFGTAKADKTITATSNIRSWNNLSLRSSLLRL